MSRYEERLLHDLRGVVAARPTPAAAAVQRPSRRPRLVLAGGGGVAVAVSAGLLLFSGSSGVSPAFAVDKASDGTVTVRVNSLDDADGLQRKLREAGLPAVVSYSPTAATLPDKPACTAGAPGGPAGAQGVGVPATARAPERGLSEVHADDRGPSFSTGGTAPPAGTPAAARITSSVRVDDTGAAEFTIAPGQLKDGQKLYLTTAGGHDVSGLSMGVC